jgi:hypothetical protein
MRQEACVPSVALKMAHDGPIWRAECPSHRKICTKFQRKKAQGLKSLRENGRIWGVRGAHYRSLHYAMLRSG